MERPRIALVNAAYEPEATSRNFRRELAASLEEFRVVDGEQPPDTAYDGLVVTGSRASVYWDEPWIDATRSFVRDAIDEGVPTLGVCWGHQLVADALGGTVAPMDAYEIGYREIELTATTPLFGGIGPRFTAYTTHSDEVSALPPGTRVIAENDAAIQGFSGDGVWGVQFHPEYDMVTARSVTEAKDDLDPDRKRRALASITEANYRAACEAKAIFDNFLDAVDAA